MDVAKRGNRCAEPGSVSHALNHRTICGSQWIPPTQSQHEALNPQIHCERNQSSGFLLMLSGLIHWQQMVHWLSGSGSC